MDLRSEGRMDGERLVRTGNSRLRRGLPVPWARRWRVSAPVVSSELAPAAGGVTMLVLFVLPARLFRVSELRNLPGLG